MVPAANKVATEQISLGESRGLRRTCGLKCECACVCL